VRASVNMRAAEREVTTGPDAATPEGSCDGMVVRRKSWRRGSKHSQLREKVRVVTKETADLGVAVSRRQWWVVRVMR